MAPARRLISAALRDASDRSSTKNAPNRETNCVAATPRYREGARPHRHDQPGQGTPDRLQHAAVREHRQTIESIPSVLQAVTLDGVMQGPASPDEDTATASSTALGDAQQRRGDATGCSAEAWRPAIR
jgi:hypothetical protein